MRYYIADTHFFDDTIRRYENRPFETALQMNEKLIEWLEERIQSLEELAEFLPNGERGEIQRIEYEGMKQAYRLTIMKLKNEERSRATITF